MTRQDFTGRWHFDPWASQLQIDTPESVALVIEQDDTCFRLERALTVAGHTDTFSITLDIGAVNPPVARGPVMLHPSLEWEGEELVFRTRIVGEDGEDTNLVRYRLEDDGAILVAEERFQGPGKRYRNTWVFRKG